MRLSRILEAQPRVLGYGSEETIVFFGCGEDMEGLLDAFVEAKMILDEAGLKHNLPHGTYIVLVDIQEFLDLPQFTGWTDLQFCEWMIREIGVAAVPGSSFFKEPVNHLIRLHFAREEKTLEEALRRLRKLEELKKHKA